MAWNPFRKVSDLLEVGTANTRPLSSHSAIASPWSTNQLTQVVWSDIFDGEFGPVTRAEAMRVPAIVKGRGLICGPLARNPLGLYRAAEKLAPVPWMYRSNSDQSPYQRMLWTLDDLIFGGVSLWTVERGTRGNILDAVRVPPEWWEITPDLTILVQGREAVDGSVILFEGPQDGLLDIAGDDIRAALSMSRSWASRVKAPVPMVELHQNDDVQLEDEEIKDVINQWETARASGGATGYTPNNIDVRVHGETSTDLYVNGRNASRLDFANYLSLPANLLEGSTATASLTYSTQEGARNELVDYSLSYWAAAIEARLSLDDVVPAGQRVAFDLEWFSTTQTPPSAPPTED